MSEMIETKEKSINLSGLFIKLLFEIIMIIMVIIMETLFAFLNVQL